LRKIRVATEETTAMQALIEKMKKVKNINQTDLLELLERREQLQEIELELSMTSALGPLELNLALNGNMTATAIFIEENIINEKQIDWVTLDASY
jgi:hypothetical protein